MKPALIIGGPLILGLTATFLIMSGIVTFGDVEGMEIEQEPIEYREGDESTTVRKQPGLKKFTNINIRIPVGVENWKFIFEREAALEEVREEYRQKKEEEQEGEMIQVDPPTLSIPAN